MGSWTVTSPAYGPTAGYGHVVKTERRELAGLLAIAVVFAVACVFLGRWQYHRFQDKYAADHLVGRNYRSAPVALDRLVPGSGSTLAAKDVWRSVRVSGSYDVGAQVLVRNRPLDGAYGYEVLVPLVPASGGPALLVDRGWLPNGQTSDAPDSVPAPPAGPVTVTAHLLPSEPAKSGTLPTGQFASIDLARVAAETGQQLLPAYGVLAAESPAPATGPTKLPEPDDGGYWGVNLSYAFQWGLFGIAGLAFPFVFLRRRRRLQAQDEAALATAEPAGAADPASVPAVPAAAGRRKRTRIWDDEDD
jgi:cytochrome oxidase assembly protein ShyY1